MVAGFEPGFGFGVGFDDAAVYPADGGAGVEAAAAGFEEGEAGDEGEVGEDVGEGELGIFGEEGFNVGHHPACGGAARLPRRLRVGVGVGVFF